MLVKQTKQKTNKRNTQVQISSNQDISDEITIVWNYEKYIVIVTLNYYNTVATFIFIVFSPTGVTRVRIFNFYEIITYCNIIFGWSLVIGNEKKLHKNQKKKKLTKLLFFFFVWINKKVAVRFF